MYLYSTQMSQSIRTNKSSYSPAVSILTIHFHYSCDHSANYFLLKLNDNVQYILFFTNKTNPQPIILFQPPPILTQISNPHRRVDKILVQVRKIKTKLLIKNIKQVLKNLYKICNKTFLFPKFSKFFLYYLQKNILKKTFEKIVLE